MKKTSWTKEMDSQLRDMYFRHEKVSHIASSMGISQGSVISRLRKVNPERGDPDLVRTTSWWSENRPIDMSRYESIDPCDLSYIAGYLDGEGTFYLSNKTFKPCVTCTNTHKETIIWLKEKLGGNLTENIAGKKHNHRPTHRWSVVNKEAIALCSAILPYLKEKTEQAIILCLSNNTVGITDGGRTPKEILEHRKELKRKLTELKNVKS